MTTPSFFSAIMNLSAQDVLNLAAGNINEKDMSGRSWAMAAAMRGHEETLKVLIEAGADLSLVDEDHYSAMMLASMRNRVSSIRVLHDAGYPLDEQSSSGMTPLLLAMSEGGGEAALFLMSLGADPTIKNDKGETAFGFLNSDLPASYSTLLEKLSQDYPGFVPLPQDLLRQCNMGRLNSVCDLIEAGADPNFILEDGTHLISAMSRVLSSGFDVEELLNKMIDLGLDPLLPDGSGRSLASIIPEFSTQGQDVIRQIISDHRAAQTRGRLIEQAHARLTALEQIPCPQMKM